MALEHAARRRLTDAEMDRIIDAARRSWVDAVIETFRCLGVDFTDPAVKEVKPWDYAIPQDQWGRIATACDSGSSLDRANHMLDWMNKGPSVYEEGEGP